jgi:hypothetical protein
MRRRMLPSPLQNPAAETNESDWFEAGSKPMPLSQIFIVKLPL